jgi:hypothetical protein
MRLCPLSLVSYSVSTARRAHAQAQATDSHGSRDADVSERTIDIFCPSSELLLLLLRPQFSVHKVWDFVTAADDVDNHHDRHDHDTT